MEGASIESGPFVSRLKIRMCCKFNNRTPVHQLEFGIGPNTREFLEQYNLIFKSTTHRDIGMVFNVAQASSSLLLPPDWEFNQYEVELLQDAAQGQRVSWPGLLSQSDDPEVTKAKARAFLVQVNERIH